MVLSKIIVYLLQDGCTSDGALNTRNRVPLPGLRQRATPGAAQCFWMVPRAFRKPLVKEYTIQNHKKQYEWYMSIYPMYICIICTCT